MVRYPLSASSGRGRLRGKPDGKPAETVIKLLHYVDISRHMDDSSAIDALSALAQPTRLAVFRHLAAAYPGDLAAGDIARKCAVPHNTMSSHLAILTRAGLTTAGRAGRAVRYRAALDGLSELVGFLAHDCCDGRPELCVPLAAELASPCRTGATPSKVPHG